MSRTNYQNSMALSLLCFIKRSKVNHSSKVPLYLRISFKSERVEISLQRFIDPLIWDSKRQQLKGRTEETRITNEYIRTVKMRLYTLYNNLLGKSEELTASILKNSFLGKDEEQKTILQVFEYHNLRQKQQIGKGVAKGTHDRYVICLRHIESFLEWKFKRKDIPLSLLNYEIISDLEFYFRTVRNCGNNTTLKYLSNFKKIIHLARKLGWMTQDPFFGFEGKLEPVDRGYLTEGEVTSIAQKTFSIDRLNYVRDVFLFSCYTGLAYADVEKLSANNIILGIDGKKWVHIERTKTGVTSKIPLLPLAEGIINRYANNPECLNKGKLLPVISNQKMNSYLKEIADVCGIQKNLTFHVSRHTFATTITLSNKVPIESVSKMLGHKSIKTTQIYSRVLDQKVCDDMSHLQFKYSNQNPEEDQRKIKSS